MQKKIVITAGVPRECFCHAEEELSRMGFACDWKTREALDAHTGTEVLKQVRGANIAINGGEAWTREVFEGLPELELLIRFGAGYDAVDLKAAIDAGVPVVNLPGANAQAVAEHTVALMLAVTRHIAFMDRCLRASDLDRAYITVHQLSGKTVGILGGGNIGERVIRALNGFGCRFLLHDPVRKPELERMENLRYCDRDEVLGSSDLISLNLPLTEETYHLIDRRTIAKMKPEAILINTARGGLVCSDDLAQALREGRIAGAGLDVFEEEGSLCGSQFMELDNVVMTPHVASGTLETYRYMSDLSLEIIRNHVEGKPLGHVLNPDYAAVCAAR